MIPQRANLLATGSCRQLPKVFLPFWIKSFPYQIVSPPSRNVIVESIKKMEDPNARGWTSSSTNNKTVSFNTVTHVYVLGTNQKYIKTKPTKGSILKVFKDKKKELESFILSKNIEINEAEDLDKVVGYYHSLK